MSGFDKVSKIFNTPDSRSSKEIVYLYGDIQPNAPVSIGGTSYKYDKAGNPTSMEGTAVNRTLQYDGDNRLRRIDDMIGGTTHLYTYDHTGERALKRYGTATTVSVNGAQAATLIDQNESYSAYFSPYFVETNNGRYSKHYYAGTQRMASRVEFMPKGMGEEPQQPEQAEQPDSQEQASEMASGQTELTDENGNASDGNANGEKQPSKEEKEAMREYQKLQQMEVAKVDASGGSESASGTEESEAVEPDLYYYHTDHLGSTTFITDRDGNVAQYLAYTPYGETFIEERDVTPYKFNGKELDAETGLYYYGARYYDPTTALWLGVDPLAEKYPGVSPYVYCMGNPVLLIDEDGCESRSFDDKVGDVLRDVTGMHSEIQEAKSVQPLAEGAALLNPFIGIANDVKTLATGADIYGNEASSLDKVIAVVDIASFGIAKAAGAEKVVSAIGSACASKIEKVANGVNKVTTFVSAGLTIYRGYEKK